MSVLLVYDQWGFAYERYVMIDSSAPCYQIARVSISHTLTYNFEYEYREIAIISWFNGFLNDNVTAHEKAKITTLKKASRGADRWNTTQLKCVNKLKFILSLKLTTC